MVFAYSYISKKISWLYVELPLLWILFLPGLMVVYRGAPSMSDGLALALFFYTCLLLLRWPFLLLNTISVKYLVFVIISLILIVVHFGVVGVWVWSNVEFERFIFSLLLMFFIFIVAPIFYNDLLFIGQARFSKICHVAFWLMSMIGCASAIAYLMDLNPYKKVLLFNEPSHFALIYLPFLLYVSFISGKWARISYLFIALFIALAFKNLTLLFGIFLLLFPIYGIRRVMLVLMVVMPIAIFLLAENMEYGKYYFDRLNFSSDTENFSAMVYMSGAERAYLTIVDSFGFGLGFQQMGIVGPQGQVMEDIIAALGATLNHNDGGFLGAKFVAEFGIFGIAFLALYIFRAFELFLILRLNCSLNKINLFFICVFLTFSIELFVRGAGYFTPSVFMFILSIYSLFFLNLQDVYKEGSK